MFGAGYPSLPTVSLEEFYEKTYREQVEAQRRWVGWFIRRHYMYVITAIDPLHKGVIITS